MSYGGLEGVAMFRMKAHKTVSSLVAGLVCLAAPQAARAATFANLPGSLVGIVSDYLGAPKMGAAVQLYDRQQRFLYKVSTDALGRFQFLNLDPALYTVRITRIPYDPAMRRDIAVRSGERSTLTVSLSSLFSSIQISYPTVEDGSPMTDEWKWVLRSAPATRPVFRFTPDETVPPDTPETLAAEGMAREARRVDRTAMFSDTRGIVRVSAGDRALSQGVGTQADLGTTFALATALYGESKIQVSGNLGYGAQTGVPSAAFRTSYSRGLGGGNPEVSLTVRQMLMPERLIAAFAGQESGLPMVRTMSAAIDDQAKISNRLTLQYGSTFDYVSFFDRLDYFSPYVRLNYQVTENAALEFAFTSGNARTDLAGTDAENADLQRNLDTLCLFPQFSEVGGHVKLQRGDEYELAYSHKVESRVYRVSAYHESVANAALSMVAPAGMFSTSDLMPDLFSNNTIFNAGNFESSGYSASVTQGFGQDVNVSLIFGSTGGLTTSGRELVSDSPDELRAMIHMGRKNAATMRLAARVPHAGTHLTASYQWAGDQRWAMTGNLYSTQPLRPMPGLNLIVRQPIPGLSRRVEATAEFSNMLAQGYLPIFTADGQRILLVENPRSLKGGLNFIF
jgi:hypothetical protein